MLNDFKIKFICKYDPTFWLHMAREFLIFQVIYWINHFLFQSIYFTSDFTAIIGIIGGASFALGVNLAWEWQDGLLNDGFNILDFIAGLIGIGTGMLLLLLK